MPSVATSHIEDCDSLLLSSGNGSVKDLDYRKLIRLCKLEIREFQRNRQGTTPCCEELWYRTFKQQSPVAWDYFYEVYCPEVKKWATRHPRATAFGEELDYIANGALSRLARYMTPTVFDSCRDLAALLSYLGSCINAEIIDYLRRRMKQDAMNYLREVVYEDEGESSLDLIPDGSALPDDVTLYAESRMELWNHVNSLLTSEQETVIVHAAFVLGLKTQQIYEQHSDRFRDVREVYQIKGNMLRRIRRHLADETV